MARRRRAADTRSAGGSSSASASSGCSIRGRPSCLKRQQLRAQGKTLTPEEEEALTAPILALYEQESNAYYGSARLWDDGIIDPVDTRDVLGLTLAVALRTPIPPPRHGVSGCDAASPDDWEGDPRWSLRARSGRPKRAGEWAPGCARRARGQGPLEL